MSSYTVAFLELHRGRKCFLLGAADIVSGRPGGLRGMASDNGGCGNAVNTLDRTSCDL